MTTDVLTERALNRTTLARQLLLERVAMPVVDTVHHLVGMQAQVPGDPYVALWSRLDRFDPEELSGALADRRLVRTWVMRGTIHLVTAEDCLSMRPLVQPVIDGGLTRNPDAAPHLDGVDLEPVVRFARELLDEAPRTGTELRAAIAERFPERDARALVIAAQCRLPLVQVPPRGLWRQHGQVRTATAEAWLGQPLATEPSIDDLVLRYLRAFGPASGADMATWSRLTGLREVVDRLGPALRTVRDNGGRELFDVADAPRAEPDAPAPVRFLPEYDNVLLSHADRSRFFGGIDVRPLYAGGGLGRGSVLHDGVVKATWRLERDAATDRTTMAVTHLPMAKRALASIEAEGRRLLRFLVDGDAELVARVVTS